MKKFPSKPGRVAFGQKKQKQSKYTPEKLREIRKAQTKEALEANGVKADGEKSN